MHVLVVAHAMLSYGTRINRVCMKLMAAHGSSSHCLRLLKHDQMIVDANVSDDELGRTQSHRDHYGAPVASRDSQRQGMVWRRVRHYLAVQILLAWSLLGAALQSCALDAVYVSEVHVHACCMPSRAARAKEVLMEVEASCAEHGAVASASPRDGSWQLQVHLLIARRTARVRSGCLSGWRHAWRVIESSVEGRVFTCARAGTVSVHLSDEHTRSSPSAS